MPKSEVDEIKNDAKQVFNLIKDGGWGYTSMQKIAFNRFDAWRRVHEFPVDLKLPEADWLIGLCYRLGVNVSKNDAKAKELYIKAAENDCSYAATCLDYDQQIADCIYKAWRPRQQTFTASDVLNVWRTNCPLPPISLDKLKEKMMLRKASQNFYETISAIRFKVEFSDKDRRLTCCTIIFLGEH